MRKESTITELDIYTERPQPLLDEAGEASGWYKQLVAKTDVVNGNQRLYPRQLYQDALEELRGRGFPYAGEHPHPPSYQGMDKQIHFKSALSNVAVKFRNAYLDESGNVWAEYKPLATPMGELVQELIDNQMPVGFSNRMTGTGKIQEIDGKPVQVVTGLRLYTWDIVTEPAEPGAFQRPVPLADNQKEEAEMDFFSMTLEELKNWRQQNGDSEEAALCDSVMALKQEKEQAEQKAREKEQKLLEKQRQEQEQAKREQVRQALCDAVEKLPCTEDIKELLKKQGERIMEIEQIAPFLDERRQILDRAKIDSGLQALGMKTGKAVTVTTDLEEGKTHAFVDAMMEEMDRELLKRNNSFQIDKQLRQANLAIVDGIFQQMERKQTEGYRAFQASLRQEAQAFTDEASPMIADTGKFAQSAGLSLAIMRQAFQDIRFMQLCLSESFSGTTYKMPVEFQSHDLFTEDDFVVGELAGIPTDSVQTFLLEYDASWLKRGFVVTKEAEKEMRSGPMHYDVIAANAASIADRFRRAIDRMIAVEMLSCSDEYHAKRVEKQTVAATEYEAVTPGVNAPEETNAACRIRLLCGNSSPLSASAVLPPVVRPRQSVWLDQKGRKQQEYINSIVVKTKAGKELAAGNWISSRGVIADKGTTAADYAVDYENACIYFRQGAISDSALPTVSYSYATNVEFFNLSFPDVFQGFSARYYNQLLELIDRQKAYMGSAPRYVTPDFVLGSFHAMTPIKQAELFYTHASPAGTSLLGGEMYFAKRNGLDFAEHNSPWPAGDDRLLLGRRNATRFGIGSPYELEGPHPHIVNGSYTSAKEYFATQQAAVHTPLVIDENGIQYHPPFRTIKLYRG